MLDKLFSSFSRDRNDSAPDESALPKAIAALLVEAARADEDYTDLERELIDKILRRQFDIDGATAQEIRTDAEAAQAAAHDMYGFSRVVKEQLDYTERTQLIEDMWVIALSDVSSEPYEEMIIRRLLGLIHVEDVDSTAARHRAAERLKSS